MIWWFAVNVLRFVENHFVNILICYTRCFEEAKNGKNTYFYIEFLGECRVPKEDLKLDVKPKSPKRCKGDSEAGADCVIEQGKTPMCVGTESHGYVYEIVSCFFTAALLFDNNDILLYKGKTERK